MNDLQQAILAAAFGGTSSADASSADAGPWKLGKSYLIRTVTMAWTGRLVSVDRYELVLEDAAWVADIGRYADATTAEALSEVEPRDGPVIIGRGVIVDAVEWTGPLPRGQK